MRSRPELIVPLLFSVALSAVGLSSGCNRGAEPAPAAAIEATQTSGPAATGISTSPAATKPVRKKAVDPIVVLRTSAGDIKIQLFAEKAPQTVDNFLRNYVRRGFYEGTIVHHADSAMVIAGGFGADLQPKETRAEIYNESANGLPNVAGSVAMARSPDVPHSATSQFFINLTDNDGFNYQQTDEGEAFGYCVFGKVLEGMEVAKTIASMPVSQQGDFPSVPNPLVTIQAVEQIQ